VAERLRAEDRTLLKEALAAARKITDEISRASVLSALARRMDTEDREMLQEALAAAREITDGYSRASALSAVVESIELTSLVELFQSWPALIEYPSMLPGIERVAGVWGEFCRLQGADPADVFNSWLLRLARSHRSHVINVMRRMIPVIETIGGATALRDMALAIADAGRWWP
jgi:hypothetical protein